MARCHPSLILPIVLLSLLQCTLATEDQVLVESWKVTSDIRFRFATTQIRSVVLNADSDRDREAQFHIVLPEDAFITNFTMEMEGVVNVGVVKEKEEAKADYEAAKQRGESAGLFRTQPRHTNKFDYSVNVHPLQRVIFTLTYQEVLRRKFGRYDHVVHLLTDAKVGHMTIDVTIHETKELSMLDIPDFPDNLEPTPDEKNLVLVDRPTPTSALIHYEHTVTSENNATQTPPTFTVRYDVKRDLSAGEVLVVDGYFIHFFAPSSLPAIPKDIIFVLDVSGSMIGRKIDQLKEAMTRIVQEMQGQDRFNILTFHGETEFWRQGRLTQADSQGKREALAFVSDMVANGMTNIHAALTEAVQFLLEYRNPRHVPVIFFLTDGLPSSGTRSSQQIASDVKELNAGVASIHGLAFGDNADYDLLKKVSSQNAGVARKIYEASDAAMQVTGFYDEISTVTLDKLQIEYVNDTVDQSSLTQTDFKNFFNGSEVMVAGKLTNLHNLIDIVIQGVGAQGEVNLVLEDDEIFTDVILPDEGHGITDVSSLSSMAEKSWAFLTIKDLLQQKLKSDVDAEREAIDKRILELSLKYNFVTPLTSIVVTQKKENKTEVPIYDSDSGRGTADMMSSSHSYSTQFRAYGYASPSLSDPSQVQSMPRRPAYMHSAPLPTMTAPRGLHGLAGGPLHIDPVQQSLPNGFLGLPPPGLGGVSRRYKVKKGSGGSGGSGGKKGRGKQKKNRKQKRPPPTCTYLGYANLQSMNLTGPSLTSSCHVDGPKKFPPGEFTLYSLDNGDSVRIVTTKGKRNINGLVSLVLTQGENTTIFALHSPSQSDVLLQPRPGYVIRRAGSELVVTTPELELRVHGTENQKGRRRCFKWFSYSISILLRGPLSTRDKASKSIFPDACKTPLSKKFLRMRRRPPT